MIERLWRWALRQLQRRCVHPPRHVMADVIEGGYPPFSLRWCRLCGAHRFVAETGEEPTNPWRTPRPDWEGLP